jgi:hypothetical protein
MQRKGGCYVDEWSRICVHSFSDPILVWRGILVSFLSLCLNYVTNYNVKKWQNTMSYIIKYCISTVQKKSACYSKSLYNLWRKFKLAPYYKRHILNLFVRDIIMLRLCFT